MIVFLALFCCFVKHQEMLGLSSHPLLGGLDASYLLLHYSSSVTSYHISGFFLQLFLVSFSFLGGREGKGRGRTRSCNCIYWGGS